MILKNKRFIAIITILITMTATLCQVWAEQDVSSEVTPSVQFKLSEPDKDGFLTASLIIYNASFIGVQFGFSFDNKVLSLANKETGEPSENFADVHTLYPFKNEKGTHEFIEIAKIDTASNTDGILKFASYGMPSDVTGPKALVVIGNEGFKMYDFTFKVLKNEDPGFELLDYNSTVFEKEAMLAGESDGIAFDFEFVIPAALGAESNIINIIPKEPQLPLSTRRAQRLADSLILNIDNYAAVRDGFLKWVDSNNKNVMPFIKDDRTYVPLRFVGESFKADVNWDADQQKVTVVLDNKTVEMKIGQKSYTINGESYDMDVAPVIVEDRTFIPIRYIGEALDKSVLWDSTQKVVIVTPFDRPWDSDNEVEKGIMSDAMIIMSSLVRDLYFEEVESN